MAGITSLEMERQAMYCVDQLNRFINDKEWDKALGYARCMYDFGLYPSEENLHMFENTIKEKRYGE